MITRRAAWSGGARGAAWSGGARGAAWSGVSLSLRDTYFVSEQGTDWVALAPRFTPGWPWPETSYGLGPMYGDLGWCRECGTPLTEQCGALVIQGSKFPSADVWMPNWLFDVFCVSAKLADEVKERFAVDLGEVRKPRKGPTGVQQLLPKQTVDSWYQPDELSEAVTARHSGSYGDQTGSSCRGCDRWKWLPVREDDVPIAGTSLMASSDVIASPETFGDGLVSFRHVLFRRNLGEMLVTTSPRNWDLVEVRVR